MSNVIYTALEYFLVYSFLGWCTEVAFQAVAKGQVINRGFLNGPVCPIYGFGVLSVFRMLEIAGEGELHEQNALQVFIFGVILATSIELLGGWLLDKLFHARWWDYSNQPFNLHGYICLEFSIIWGLGILLVVRGINPMIMYVLGLLPRRIGWMLIAIFSVIFIADVIVSVLITAGLNKRMAELDNMRGRMRIVSDDLSERIGTRALGTAQQIDEAKEKASRAKSEAMDQAEFLYAEYETKRAELLRRIKASRHFGLGRLLRAFPNMKHRDHSELLEMLRRDSHESDS